MVEETMAPKFWPLNDIGKNLLDFCNRQFNSEKPQGAGIR